jgi:hypothetical protein
MSETKFTPGPWVKNWTAPYNVSGQGGSQIATVHFFSNEECQGNADLIAAAPELYEALENALDRLDDISIYYNIDLSEEIKAANAALAKARGEKAEKDDNAALTAENAQLRTALENIMPHVELFVPQDGKYGRAEKDIAAAYAALGKEK